MKITSGQVAVITGGASGIGFGLADSLGRRGVRLVVADARQDGLSSAEATLRDAGFDVLAVHMDVTDAAAVQGLADQTVNHFGRVDMICNNAGIVGPIAPTWEQSLDGWSRLIAVKLMGVVHGIRAFAPLLVAQQAGHIVNTASAGGLMPLPGMAPYNATMHAVVGITETLDIELKAISPQLGATVVCPGLVATPLIENTAALCGESTPSLQFSDGEALAAQLADTKSPEIITAQHVADATITAIEQDRLHIMPGANGNPAIRQRLDSILNDLTFKA